MTATGCREHRRQMQGARPAYATLTKPSTAKPSQ